MQRVLIAAVAAAFFAATAAPALADDYPPCTSPGQDHCRVVHGGGDHHHGHMDHHHHGHGHGGHHHGGHGDHHHK